MGFDLLFYTCSFNVLVYIEITAQFRSQIRSHMQLKVAAEGASQSVRSVIVLINQRTVRGITFLNSHLLAAFVSIVVVE